MSGERNMSWDERIEQLRAERARFIAFDADRPISDGRLTPRGRLAQLLDDGSLIELGGLATGQQEDPSAQAPGDGLVAGYGTINARPVAVLSEDPIGLARTDAQVARNKRTRLISQAVWRELPLIYIADGSADDHPLHPPGQGMLLDRMADQRPARHIGERSRPFVTVVAGACSGQDATIVAHADLVIATSAARLSLGVASEAMCDVIVASDAEAIVMARRAIDLIESPVDDVSPTANDLDVFDAGSDLRLGADVGVSAGLARIGGRAVAFAVCGGDEPCRLGADALRRIARASSWARRFSLPFVALQHCDGYGSEPGTLGLAASIVDDLRACTSSAVLSVVRGNGFVLGDFVLGGRAAGYDLIVAWPQARFSAADTRMHDIDAPRYGPWDETGLALVDDVIAPEETHAFLSRAIALLSPPPRVPPLRGDRGQSTTTLY